MQIELTYGACSAVVDTLGGELVSYRDEYQTEYIWHGDPAYWSGRNPLLFPIVGSLKDGRIEVDGRDYHMGRHGFARLLEYQLVEQTPDSAVLELKSNADTLAQYPFHFTLRVEHRLVPNGFRTALSVCNNDARPMPFCIGAHTAFNCPLYPGERFEDYIVRFDQKENLASLLPTPEGYLSMDTRPCLPGTDYFHLDHTVFDAIDTIVLEGLGSTAAQLINPATNRGVRIEFSGFPILSVWTMPHKKAPYICLEPWHGCSHVPGEGEGFEHKRHVVRLEPNEKADFAYGVYTLI